MHVDHPHLDCIRLPLAFENMELEETIDDSISEADDASHVETTAKAELLVPSMPLGFD